MRRQAPGKPRAAHAARKDDEEGWHTDEGRDPGEDVPFIPSHLPLRGIIVANDGSGPFGPKALLALQVLLESLQSGREMMSQIHTTITSTSTSIDADASWQNFSQLWLVGPVSPWSWSRFVGPLTHRKYVFVPTWRSIGPSLLWLLIYVLFLCFFFGTARADFGSPRRFQELIIPEVCSSISIGGIPWHTRRLHPGTWVTLGISNRLDVCLTSAMAPTGFSPPAYNRSNPPLTRIVVCPLSLLASGPSALSALCRTGRFLRTIKRYLVPVRMWSWLRSSEPNKQRRQCLHGIWPAMGIVYRTPSQVLTTNTARLKTP